MLVVNLTGGPGSGKTTTSAIIFSELKLAGYKAELVGEIAREYIYDGATPMLENQVLILGQQWQRITRLLRSGADVAICDSPLALCVMYSQRMPYNPELVPLVRKLESLCPETFNIWVRRVKPYNTFGRYQNEEQARELDQQASMLLNPVHLSVTGDRSGAIHAAAAVLERLSEPRAIGS